MRNSQAIYGIIERYDDDIKYEMSNMKAKEVTDGWLQAQATESACDVVLESCGGKELDSITIEECEHLLLAAKEASFATIIQPMLISLLKERIEELEGR
jgi:hypothetical protein